MASESFFNNTTFFHTTYGMFHFNPDSGNSPILLLFSSYKFFSLRFFWGMHTSMTFVCGAKPHNPKVSDTKQVVLYAMSFFTTITCWLPVFVRRTGLWMVLSVPSNRTSSHLWRMCISHLELRSGNSPSVFNVWRRISERRWIHLLA